MGNRNRPRKKRPEDNRRTRLETEFEIMPISKLCLTRYTFDSWMKCYPNSNRQQYEMCQSPNNLMEYLSTVVATSFPNKRPTAKVELALKLLDDDYFKWLGNRENSEAARTEYAQTPPFNINVRNANLDVSRWVFGLPVIGVVEGTEVDARLDKKTVAAISKYYRGIVNDPAYSFYVAPYVMRGEDLVANKDKILQMAGTWFNDRVSTIYGEFAKMEFQQENTAILGVIPVVVQLKHDLDNLAIGNVLNYMGADFPEEDDYYCDTDMDGLFRLLGYDETVDRPQNVPLFEESDAGKAIIDWERKCFLGADDEDFGGYGLSPLLIICEEILKYRTQFINVLEREQKKTLKSNRRIW